MNTKSTPLWARSASDLASALAAGDVTSRALVDACRARAAEVNPAVNALVHEHWDQAAVQADASDAARAGGEALGPLAGLPITIKESIETAGLPTTLGVEHRRNQAPATRDAACVRAAVSQGAIVVGKTNIPQLLLFNETDNRIWGRTNNPWSADRVPGGSSGGEGAALATGMAPIGIGTDIGGSIRVPAAYCGIAGLKPTVDRWSADGVVGAIAGQEAVRGQCGPMARTARDVALLFTACDGPLHHALDATVPPVACPPEAFKPDAPRDLVVGWFDNDGYLTPSPAVKRAVHEATQALDKDGWTVRPIQPEAARELMDTYYAALSSDGTKTAARFLAGDPVVPQLSNLFRMAKMPGAARMALATVMGLTGNERTSRLLRALGEKSVARYWELVAKRTEIRRRVLAAWDAAGVDVVLSPPHATPPLRHGQTADFSVGGCYAMRFNLLNFPAGVVPVTTVQSHETTRPAVMGREEKVAQEADRGSAGLPVAVQVAARPWREHEVLRVMVALEDALAGGEHVPVTPVTPR